MFEKANENIGMIVELKMRWHALINMILNEKIDQD